VHEHASVVVVVVGIAADVTTPVDHDDARPCAREPLRRDGPRETGAHHQIVDHEATFLTAAMRAKGLMRWCGR
jgi:hypothetical protein